MASNKRNLISEEDVVPEAENPDREHSPIKLKTDALKLKAGFSHLVKEMDTP